MRTIILSLISAGFMIGTCHAVEPPDPYDALYNLVTGRQGPGGETVGLDSPFPLIWNNSRFLFNEGQSRKLIDALDAFNALPQEKIRGYGSVKRALLQRHLWTVFDWTTERQTPSWVPEPEQLKFDRLTFQKGIASLLKRLALSKEEILALPNTVAATVESRAFASKYDPDDAFKPFFPADLLDKESSWVCLGNRHHRIPARSHTEAVRWRSVFLIFMRLPGGRDETLAYIKHLIDFHDPWVIEEPPENNLTTPKGGINDLNIYVNPKTPQFPVGTQFALVEQAFLISNEGELVLSPLTVGVQFRAYLRLDSIYDLTPPQAVAEFVMQPPKLMGGEAAMRAIGKDEIHYSTIFTSDPFEHGDPGRQLRPRLEDCRTCHSAWGIHSVNSRSELLQDRSLLPPQFQESPVETISQSIAGTKRQDYTWGLLEGLWRLPLD
ncbi:MAG: hypothetical protein ABI680_04140 [Chthoniobacteraceae bacterium]